MDKTKEAYDKAVWILEKCSTHNGFFAAYPGYDMVFARDSMIISLGASLIKNSKMRDTFRKSLITLGENQSIHGQIPNAVDKFVKGRKHHVDFQSIDSTLWFLIGHKVYEKTYRDTSLLKKYKKHIDKSLNWIACQDMGEDIIPEQLPTTDWQDAFPHKYGHTINTLALYYHVLNLYGKKSVAQKMKELTDKDTDLKLWNGNFYIPWRWKNHGEYREEGSWFDSLGNILAIVWGLSDKNKSEKILRYIKNKKINLPYPVKAIFPPIKKGSKDWRNYFLDCEAGKPYHYLNAGIWTFIGGFYVCALVKMKKLKEAKTELEKLAEANMLNNGNFAEWLDGKTGKIGKSEAGMTSFQGWNAAMYIVAYESVKKKKCLI